jgi:hypothetical protein
MIEDRVTGQKLSSQLAESTKDIININNRDYEKMIPMQMKGLCVRTWNTGDLYSNRYRVDAIAKANTLNCNMIELIVNIYQPTPTDNNPTSRIPIPQVEIQDYITFLKSKGFKVFFKPHIEIDQSPYVWRADIDPSNSVTWFSNYTNLMTSYATMCQNLGVEMFSVGSEFTTLTSKYPSQWSTLIDTLRPLYKGLLTYGANYTSPYYDEGNIITFWDKLDVIGLDYYVMPSTNTTLTKDQLIDRIRHDDNHYNELQAIDQLFDKYKKPVIFAEYGYGTDTALQFQSDYTGALFETFGKRDYMKGFFAWVFDPFPTNFVADGSLVETTIKNYHAKKVQEVTTSHGIFSTQKNGNGIDQWTVIATLKCPIDWSWASLTLLVESRYVNTTNNPRGTIYARLGFDGSNHFSECYVMKNSNNLDSTRIGYAIDTNHVLTLYAKVGASGGQYFYKPLLQDGVVTVLTQQSFVTPPTLTIAIAQP